MDKEWWFDEDVAQNSAVQTAKELLERAEGVAGVEP